MAPKTTNTFGLATSNGIDANEDVAKVTATRGRDKVDPFSPAQRDALTIMLSKPANTGARVSLELVPTGDTTLDEILKAGKDFAAKVNRSGFAYTVNLPNHKPDGPTDYGIDNATGSLYVVLSHKGFKVTRVRSAV